MKEWLSWRYSATCYLTILIENNYFTYVLDCAFFEIIVFLIDAIFVVILLIYIKCFLLFYAGAFLV